MASNPDPSTRTGHLKGVSVIVPASNEADRIGACLHALAASTGVPDGVAVEVIVSSNASTDGTAAAAHACSPDLRARRWTLRVIERSPAGKIAALNAADAAASHAARVYLDADVTVSPPLLGQLLAVLDRAPPVYSSGRMNVTAQGRTARRFARIYRQVPFVANDVPGAGLYAVNGTGRARWDRFPDVIADDLFVRLCFAPEERFRVDASYDWPLVEGLRALVRVRRRQDRGNRQLARMYPELAADMGTTRTGLARAARLAMRDPVGFAVYVGVLAMARVGRGATDAWERGR